MAYYREPKQGVCQACGKTGPVVESKYFLEYYCKSCYIERVTPLYKGKYRPSKQARSVSQRSFEQHHGEMCRRYFPDAFAPDGAPKDLPDIIDLAALSAALLAPFAERIAWQPED